MEPSNQVETDQDLKAKRSLRTRIIKTTSKDQQDSSSESSTTSSVASSKRSSRLRDPEFAAKQKAFLQKVVTATNGSMDSYLKQETQVENNMETENSAGLKRKLSTTSKISTEAVGTGEATNAKRRKSSRASGTSGTDSQNDCYCWICHKEGEVICCETCPRVFHLKCIQLEFSPTEDWVCPECVLIMTAENMDTRSRAMRLLTVDQLCVLLRHALTRMKTVSGVDPFIKPVDSLQFPAYTDYVFCPMDMNSIEKNIKKKQYGSTEALLADMKWILHNCIIFNSLNSKLTSSAKSLVKVCKHEMQEIENCPDCYLNAHTKKESWFVAACRIPHLLVWAKLKGFPFWPGKAMRINSEDNVDVRFFGAHDRAWIPLKDAFLYSVDPPVVMKNKKKGNLEGCVHEVDMYIKNIAEKFGKFEYAPFKTNLDAKKEEEQIKTLFPACTLPFELGPIRRRARTYSFSGSERSHTGTPTPSDMDPGYDDDSQSGQDEPPQTDVLEDDLNLDQPPPAHKEDVEDELLMDTAEIPETKSEAPMKATEAIKTSDRAVASPPCEVSSTTLNSNEEKAKSASNTSVATSETVKEATKATKSKIEIIAETSETVVIEGETAPDEEEIDDVEPEAAETASKQPPSSVEETAVTEPPTTKEPSKITEEAEVVQPNKKPEEPEKTEADPEKQPQEDKIQEVIQEKESTEEDKKKIAAAAASSEEEIDDEEPEMVIDEADEAIDTSRRLKASGVSVTVIEKSNQQAAIVKTASTEASEAIKKNEIGLSSDISVTVVHKKKIETGSGGLKISVKKESELLQEPLAKKQDIVEVTRTKQPRRSSIEVEGVAAAAAVAAAMPPSRQHLGSSKMPPDPIVTISKVQTSTSQSGSSASLLKSHAPLKASSPAPLQRGPPGPSAASSLNSLASILGQPRMQTGCVQPPRFGGGGRSMAPPPQMPRNNSSPLMMGYRPPTSMGMGMPSLHPRPPAGVLSAPPPSTPSGAGPVSEQLTKVAGKLVDFMRGTLEELFRELSQQGSPEATIKALQIEMEKMQWRHQQEMAEVKHNADLILMELRQSMEAEKQKIISDFKKQAELEKHKAISETKKKQWCSNCGKEAIFYCCWNTSYCDYPCQQAHWPSHMSTCAQNQSNQDEDDQNEASAPGHEHPGAPSVGHFLNSSQHPPNGASRNQPNGLGSMGRGIQGGPMMMPFGPQGGLSPRMMNQINMRMAAAAAAAGQPMGGPRGSLGQLRFPGSSYFM